MATPGQVLTVQMLCAAMIELIQVNINFAHSKIIINI